MVLIQSQYISLSIRRSEFRVLSAGFSRWGAGDIPLGFLKQEDASSSSAQWFSKEREADFAPQGTVVTSGDILGCHRGREGASRWRLGRSPLDKGLLAQNVIHAKFEELCFSLMILWQN